MKIAVEGDHHWEVFDFGDLAASYMALIIDRNFYAAIHLFYKKRHY